MMNRSPILCRAISKRILSIVIVVLSIGVVCSQTKAGSHAAYVTDSLAALYPLREASGTIVHDESGIEPALDLEIKDSDAIVWKAQIDTPGTGPGLLKGPGVHFKAGTASIIRSINPPVKLIEQIKPANAISIEAWICTEDITQSGPARIVTFSLNPERRYFSLNQKADAVQVRLRTGNTTFNGQPFLESPPGTLAASSVTHIVATRDASGERKLYINGDVATQDTITGDLSPWWSNYGFAFGNELTGDRPWNGTLYRAALYKKALSREEVLQNYRAGYAPLSVAAHPQDVTVLAGDTVTMSAQFVGEGQLQWQYNDGTGWKDVETGMLLTTDGTEAFIDFTARVHMDGDRFRCRACNSVCVDTTAATLTLKRRVTDHLVVLYTFKEGGGNTVTDVSGAGVPLDLEIPDPEAVQWHPDQGLEIRSPTLIRSLDPASKISKAVKPPGSGLTIEGWVKPADRSQGGPARIMTVSKNTNRRNFTLGQRENNYDVRIRTTATTFNGLPGFQTNGGQLYDQLTHVLCSLDATGVRKLYVNGIESAGGRLEGDFSNWNWDQALALGNEMTGDRPWLGELYLLAVYSKALSESEIDTNIRLGPGNDYADIVPPGVPAIKSAVAASSQRITVRWEAVTDLPSRVWVDRCTVYRNGEDIGTYCGQVTDDGLSPDTTYRYEIVAVDDAQNRSRPSEAVSVTTAPDTTAPDVPQNLSGEVLTADRIALSWEAVIDSGGAGLAGYRVYRNGAVIAEPDGVSYLDTGLLPQTRYRYQVSAYDHAGNESSKSGVVELLTAALDADNDQMPDPWEYEHCFNHDCDPEADDDGDGVINWIEYQVGADPQTADLPGTGRHYEYDALGRIVRIVRIPE